MKVHCIQGDLLSTDVDAIVNAWNRNVIPWWLLIPQGVLQRSRKLTRVCSRKMTHPEETWSR